VERSFSEAASGRGDETRRIRGEVNHVRFRAGFKGKSSGMKGPAGRRHRWRGASTGDGSAVGVEFGEGAPSDEFERRRVEHGEKLDRPALGLRGQARFGRSRSRGRWKP
jgi:hypothetical protein